jgi:hypothetical protein
MTTRAPATPDAELIGLGHLFNELALWYETAWDLSQPNWRAVSAEMDRGTKPRMAQRRADRIAPLPSPGCDDLVGRMQPISLRIMALPANTIEGLVVKAKIADFFCRDLWDVESEDDCDWDVLVARKLIKSTIEAAAAITH